MHPNTIGAPEVPSGQCMWQLTLRCLQFRGNYLCRHLPPSVTGDFCRRLDEEINSLIRAATGLDITSDDMSEFTKERVRLPVKLKGLGIRSLEERRFAEYLGGVVQGITSLIDRADENGMVKKGRYETESFVGWLGANSFDSGSENPWETLMNNGSRVGQAIKETWSHLQGTHQRDLEKISASIDPSSPLSNPAEKAGFAVDGKMLRGSVTRIISEELEKTKAKVLEESVRENGNGSLFKPSPRESLIFMNCDSFSAQFVTALPCPVGIMTDAVLQESFAQLMAQPSPAMAPFADPELPHWIGRRGKEQQVDKYGDVVARAEVNGGDWIRSHESHKLLWNGIMRKAGFATSLEARNLFHGKVPYRYLKEYVRCQTSKDAIIPDILVHGFPADNNGNGNAVVPAIFDIKTVRIDKRGVRYRTRAPGYRGKIERAVTKIEKACRSAYLRKAGVLDRKFAPDDESKPFTTAIQHTFAQGNAIPLVTGATGELGVEGHRLVETLAKHAAAREDNSDITPESVSSAKGSPYNLLLAQFRRAIGCMATRTAMEEKLRRVPLIRQSRSEANKAADNGMSNHRRSPNSHSPSWFHNFRNENIFDAFYRYRTHYDHFPSEYGNPGEF